MVFFVLPSAQAVSISPLTFELVANPGESVTNVVRVFNNTGDSVRVYIKAEDFSATGEEGRVALEEPSENRTYSLASWVNVNPSIFNLGPNETKSVEFTIDVPMDAEPGGHYASVLASVSGEGNLNSGAAVVQQVGSLLLLNVAGEVDEQIQVVEFSAPRLSESPPVPLFVRFKNTGTVHLKPSGFVIIKNIFGKEVGQIDLPQNNVLPNSIRKVSLDWDGGFLFGRYEATLAAIYGSTNTPLSAGTSFWVIPWKLLLLILVPLLVGLYFLYRGRKRVGLALRVLFGRHSA